MVGSLTQQSGYFNANKGNKLKIQTSDGMECAASVGGTMGTDAAHCSFLVCRLPNSYPALLAPNPLSSERFFFRIRPPNSFSLSSSVGLPTSSPEPSPSSDAFFFPIRPPNSTGLVSSGLPIFLPNLFCLLPPDRSSSDASFFRIRPPNVLL